MTPPSPRQPATPLADRLLTLISKFGSAEEQQLVTPHHSALRGFLGHPDSQPDNRRHELDIGIENRLTLKFSVIATRRASPWALIDQFSSWAPSLRPVSEEVLRHRLRCHAGIKIGPEGVEYELYPYETPDHRLAGTLLADLDVSQTGLPAEPYCYGFSSTGELSAYSQLLTVETTELEENTGFPIPTAGLRAKALFHSRRQPDGRWLPGKAGIEYLPFPSYLLNTVLTRFDLHFNYLLHRGGRRPYGVIGLQGGRQVLYTTLLPRPARAR